MPGRPPRPKLVHPRDLPQARPRQRRRPRRLHPRHRAHRIQRDRPGLGRGLPLPRLARREYYADWVGVANDEARHFALLRERLRELGHDYGDFDAHNGLWEMAEKTAHDGLARMALVPRVLEARGLDVTPGMIVKLRALGDDATADDPRNDPARGSRARRRRLALVPLVLRTRRRRAARALPRVARRSTRGRVLHGPFNLEARSAAGFDAEELAALESCRAERCPWSDVGRD